MIPALKNGEAPPPTALLGALFHEPPDLLIVLPIEQTAPVLHVGVEARRDSHHIVLEPGEGGGHAGEVALAVQLQVLEPHVDGADVDDIDVLVPPEYVHRPVPEVQVDIDYEDLLHPVAYPPNGDRHVVEKAHPPTVIPRCVVTRRPYEGESWLALQRQLRGQDGPASGEACGPEEAPGPHPLDVLFSVDPGDVLDVGQLGLHELVASQLLGGQPHPVGDLHRVRVVPLLEPFGVYDLHYHPAISGYSILSILERGPVLLLFIYPADASIGRRSLGVGRDRSPESVSRPTRTQRRQDAMTQKKTMRLFAPLR